MNSLKIQEIDYRLSQEYDKPIPREDYFTFIKWFDRKLTKYGTNDEFQINNNKQRIK